MSKKPKATKPGTVRKIVKPLIPTEPEKAEIVVEWTDDLYREIRIDIILVLVLMTFPCALGFAQARDRTLDNGNQASRQNDEQGYGRNWS